MSKKNPHVKKVELRILEIKEIANGKPEDAVIVALGKGPLAGTVTGAGGKPIEIFYGEMTYQRPSKNNKKPKKPVDMVEAVFVDQKAVAGNIDLKINLTCDNEFITPFVTTVPTETQVLPIHCLRIKHTLPGQINVTFLEPKQGEFVAYPAMYFHTKSGIIDPGVGVRRKPT